MNAFTRHGIERLSPSSINAWVDNPTLWCIRYLGKYKDEVGPKAHRGTAVEHGLTLLLHGLSFNEAVDSAQVKFLELCQGEVQDGVAQHIPAMLMEACRWMEETKPKLAATQLKIETYLDDIPIPFIGFVDFTFMEGPDVDLKTTERLELQRSHVRQVALYHHARQRPASLLYVTPKKRQQFIISEEECAAALNEMRSAALRLQRFLSVIDSVRDALEMLPFDASHWKVNEGIKAAHAELLGG